MSELGLPYQPLVTFTGKVEDKDLDESLTEASLNALEGKLAIPDTFKLPDHRTLVIANKYQTSFDVPLLSAMYVDKRLGGVNAVQTLARLNRTTRGKEDGLVLDFVNDADTIPKAFRNYYQITLLSEESAPDRLFTLQDDIFKFEIFNEDDMEACAQIFYNP